MASATARHILFSNEKLARKVKREIIEEDIIFEKAAKKYSKCPSGKRKGFLGSFFKGDMVKEFDEIVFSKNTPINKVVGPVKTEFGFHLIEVLARN